MSDLLPLVDQNAWSALNANYNWLALIEDVVTPVKALVGAALVAKLFRTHRFAHAMKTILEIPSLIAIRNQVLKKPFSLRHIQIFRAGFNMFFFL